jgi:uncharacterized damage-inducible protein DinB
MSPIGKSYGEGWESSLWELEDTRRRTLESLEGLDPGVIDNVPTGFENSIGALLYHIAVIEADWLYADILGIDYPRWVYEAFPEEDRDEAGHLVPARRTLSEHLATLAHVRRELLEALSRQAPDEFTRTRTSGSGELTPQWVLHHLRQHEAEHRGQIQSLRTVLDAQPA